MAPLRPGPGAVAAAAAERGSPPAFLTLAALSSRYVAAVITARSLRITS